MASKCVDEGGVALLAAWRGGDRRAGNAFVDRYFAAVYRFLRRRMADGAMAKDLAQRTFLACLESAHRFMPTVGVRVYVLGIARNILLRHFRDARPCLAAPRDPSLSPSRIVARAEEHSLVRKALATLPESLRVVLELHYWDELSVAEIAQLLAAPAGTIKWRLYRGRELLGDWISAAQVPAPPQHSTLSEPR